MPRPRTRHCGWPIHVGMRTRHRARASTRGRSCYRPSWERDGALHTGALAALATRTATVAGLNQADVNVARFAAELHDVGKLAIPETILNKPGGSTPTNGGSFVSTFDRTADHRRRSGA